MTWRIQWMPRALKDTKKLSPETKVRVVATIERFESTGQARGWKRS